MSDLENIENNLEEQRQEQQLPIALEYNSSDAEIQEGKETEAVFESKAEKNDEKAMEVEQSKSNVLEHVMDKLDKPEQFTDFQDNQALFKQEEIQKEAHLQQIQKMQKIIQAERLQNRIKVESMISQDFMKIQNAEKQGLINSLQGQNLKKEVLKKAFDVIVQNEKKNQKLIPVSSEFSKQNAIGEFNKSKPEFFNAEGRKEVLEYLKSGNLNLGKDELTKISSMVESVEQKAIERYLKNKAHEKTLKNSNEAAKQKLTANAQNSSFKDKGFSGTFTREQIGKMSCAEFAKYETLIMEQLKKGLIK